MQYVAEQFGAGKPARDFGRGEYASSRGKPRDDLSSFLLSLDASSVGFGVAVKTDAARIYKMVEKARDEWLQRNRRRLPDPVTLERERYGNPARREARNG